MCCLSEILLIRAGEPFLLHGIFFILPPHSPLDNICPLIQKICTIFLSEIISEFQVPRGIQLRTILKPLYPVTEQPTNFPVVENEQANSSNKAYKKSEYVLVFLL